MALSLVRASSRGELERLCVPAAKSGLATSATGSESSAGRLRSATKMVRALAGIPMVTDPLQEPVRRA
jgi:hypothetical protein